MKRGLLVLVLLAACTNSNTQIPTDSTTAATTSSTTETTSVATTVAPTTVPLSTTTTGTGAAFPFIVGQAGLIGYYDGEHWVTSELESPVAGGEVYRVIDLAGEVGESVGGKIILCEPAGTPLVELNPPLLVTNDEPGEVAIASASWDLLPRPVALSGEPPPDLIAEGVTFVENRGLSDPEPNVAQYLAVDLEGDGTTEEILVLNRLPEDLIGNADSYSLVLMRKQLELEPATLIVAYSQGVAEDAFVSHFVSVVADLNGDDKMELVVDSEYYEGRYTSVFEYINDDTGLLEVLVSACGA